MSYLNRRNFRLKQIKTKRQTLQNQLEWNNMLTLICHTVLNKITLIKCFTIQTKYQTFEYNSEYIFSKTNLNPSLYLTAKFKKNIYLY